MSLIELKCKNCGAILNANPDVNTVTCQYCQTTFKIKNDSCVKLDDMEQKGYQFEKGRIRAQQENRQNNHNNMNINSDSKNYYFDPPRKRYDILWLLIAWILFFTFTATYFIVKSKKLGKKSKVIILIIMWSIFLINAIEKNS